MNKAYKFRIYPNQA
ncbi:MULTISPECIES: helix-turn-helix domain-containing protein, partial [Bacillus cereus group]